MWQNALILFLQGEKKKQRNNSSMSNAHKREASGFLAPLRRRTFFWSRERDKDPPRTVASDHIKREEVCV
jgi:hypothetical protein